MGGEDPKDKPRLKPLPLGATEKEDEQLDELTAGHPWGLTVKEFLALVEERYGAKLIEFVTREPDGSETVSRYLRSADGETLAHFPANLSLEDQLTAATTGSICRRLRIPPEDFGLLPEEQGDDFDFDLN